MTEDDALARLHEILARPEFQTANTRPIWDQLLAPVINSVLDLLGQLLQVVQSSLSGREGWYGGGVLLVCVVLLGLGLGYIVRGVRLTVTRESRVRAASLAERRDRSDALWRRAEQLAAAGQLDEAAHLVYLSALYALDERALLHVERSLTNREHARRLGAEHPRLGALFGQLVERYDRLRYGHFAVEPPAFDELRRLGAAARQAAFSGSAG